MSSYLISAPLIKICGIKTSGTMLAAVFASETTDEASRLSARLLTAVIIASTGAAQVVIQMFARLRNLLMKERRNNARNCVHSSCQRIGVRLRFVAGAVAASAACSRRNETCLTSWIRRNASYLSRQNSGE